MVVTLTFDRFLMFWVFCGVWNLCAKFDIMSTIFGAWIINSFSNTVCKGENKTVILFTKVVQSKTQNFVWEPGWSNSAYSNRMLKSNVVSLYPKNAFRSHIFRNSFFVLCWQSAASCMSSDCRQRTTLTTVIRPARRCWPRTEVSHLWRHAWRHTPPKMTASCCLQCTAAEKFNANEWC